MATAVKAYDVVEKTIPGGKYKITVSHNGKTVGVFTRNTMNEARQAFHNAGYRLVAWAEDSKIILRNE